MATLAEYEAAKLLLVDAQAVVESLDAMWWLNRNIYCCFSSGQFKVCDALGNAVSFTTLAAEGLVDEAVAYHAHYQAWLLAEGDLPAAAARPDA